MLFQASGTWTLLLIAQIEGLLLLLNGIQLEKRIKRRNRSEEEEEQEQVIEAADEGEMLVLRRVLSNPHAVEDEQRENIFHSRCTFEGKVCSLIID